MRVCLKIILKRCSQAYKTFHLVPPSSIHQESLSTSLYLSRLSPSSDTMKSLACTLSVLVVLGAMINVDAILQSLGPKMGQGDEVQQLKV